ncbi:MAG: Nif3-like dinuclear metal center hexameric protein, partial [Clostridia bacterium]|nr:Nif3-like dinuclear metal center hexameric protein [Clostridia bacterium]
IVHEPMYYNHRDVHSEEPLEMEKRALAERTGLTVWRYHDHTHATRPDIIAVGQLDALDLAGEMVLTDGGDRVEYILEKPLTPLELKARMEEKWGLQNIRLCGTRETPCRRISCMFGAPGKAAFERLVQPDCEMMLIGEATEWSMAEYARDAHQLGHTKALFILGHEGSEREGMVYTAKLLRKMYPELTVQYFESGEVY